MADRLLAYKDKVVSYRGDTGGSNSKRRDLGYHTKDDSNLNKKTEKVVILIKIYIKEI